MDPFFRGAVRPQHPGMGIETETFAEMGVLARGYATHREYPALSSDLRPRACSPTQ